MNIKAKCHLKSISDTVELGLLASLVALGADLTWLLHDIAANGLSDRYIIVFLGLSAGTLVTFIALVHHHRTVYKERLRQIYTDKVQKAIARRKRDAENRT